MLENPMKTAVLVVIEHPPQNMRRVRRVAAGVMGPGICKVTVLADFLDEPEEISRVSNTIDVDAEALAVGLK